MLTHSVVALSLICSTYAFPSSVKSEHPIIPQILEPTTGISFGFALPLQPGGQGALGDDFIGNITVPLPYGFGSLRAATTTDSTAKSVRNTPSPFNVDTFMTIATNGGVVKKSASQDFIEIVQYSQTSMDGDFNVPIGSAHITLSPLSFYTEDKTIMVFRCQNCTVGVQTTQPTVTLEALFSHAAPQYLSQDALNAILPLDNATVAPFSVNLREIRRADFTELLELTGLVAQ